MNFDGELETAVVPAVSLSMTYNNIENVGLWAVLFLGIMPLGFIICGFMTWNKRRKS